MQPFVTIHFTLNPTAEELRKGREIMGLLRSMSSDAARIPADDDDDDAPVVTTDDIKRQLAGTAAVIPPPVAPETAFQTTVPAPGLPTAPAHDSRGFPWDERIHSGNKTINADGTWKKRKNVPDTTTAAVEQELAAGGRTVTPTAPLNVPAPPPVPMPHPNRVPDAAAMPPPPPSPATVPAVAAPADATTFAALMKRFSDGVAAKSWPPTTAVDMAKAVGLATTLEINKNPQIIPRVNSYLDMRAAGLSHDDAVLAIG